MSKVAKLLAHSCSAGGTSSLVDSMEDEGAEHLWQWELRDAKALPKEQRAAALALRKQAATVQARLSAIRVASKAMAMHRAGGKGAAARLAKALEALGKAKVRAVVSWFQHPSRQMLDLWAVLNLRFALQSAAAAEAELAAAREAAAAATAAKLQSAGKGKVSDEEKAAEKERARLAKEAEKVAIHATINSMMHSLNHFAQVLLQH